MVSIKKAQAAFEYLTTYGWAILTALLVVGALAYFGFLSPSNLLPNKCDFGRQLECVDYKITNTGEISLMLRNNFGKDIDITDAKGIDVFIVPASVSINNPIPAGGKEELNLTLDTGYVRAAGEKQEVGLEIIFERSGGGYPFS